MADAANVLAAAGLWEKRGGASRCAAVPTMLLALKKGAGTGLLAGVALN